MSKLDRETIKKLTQLCRIDCTEEEQNALLDDLQKILSYIELLQEIDTQHVQPCNQVLENFGNVMRDDSVGQLLSRELFLANAPLHVGGMIKVPTVIQK
jgi:aspartyl-tRNA(Asn)/glutamyl-tRNA(Gln) amidotransferase subunit C